MVYLLMIVFFEYVNYLIYLMVFLFYSIFNLVCTVLSSVFTRYLHIFEKVYKITGPLTMNSGVSNLIFFFTFSIFLFLPSQIQKHLSNLKP